MSDTQARIGRRADGTRRVGKATAWIAAAAAVLATTFGIVLATGTSDAETEDQASTSAESGSSTGDDSLQAPDSIPQQGSGSAHTGSGGS
ncbi:hypothetical protein [Umezawaea sp. Da 62-37]|uniref:hypothetical protein n=1 Tax=Umezawaea sp. Da 62-37 TaxID=3075927 RepID=UPI0028F74BCD|nr:hypothetical protein [Umezawaea sp. Da 62-37]WNV89078.1 hypothetical protein RM788_12475 [Umezawaea sp. Da 62-37]